MPSVTVTIITLNEAEHIAAAIDSASFADEILVVDSGSSDATVDIARSKGARVLTRQWTGYVDQKNFAADQATYDWVFSLDADERIPPALATEIRTVLATEPPFHGYRVPRVTFHLGRWIRTTDFYPDYQTRLYDRRFTAAAATRSASHLRGKPTCVRLFGRDVACTMRRSNFEAMPHLARHLIHK